LLSRALARRPQRPAQGSFWGVVRVARPCAGMSSLLGGLGPMPRALRELPGLVVVFRLRSCQSHCLATLGFLDTCAHFRFDIGGKLHFDRLPHWATARSHGTSVLPNRQKGIRSRVSVLTSIRSAARSTADVAASFLLALTGRRRESEVSPATNQRKACVSSRNLKRTRRSPSTARPSPVFARGQQGAVLCSIGRRAPRSAHQISPRFNDGPRPQVHPPRHPGR